LSLKAFKKSGATRVFADFYFELEALHDIGIFLRTQTTTHINQNKHDHASSSFMSDT